MTTLSHTNSIHEPIALITIPTGVETQADSIVPRGYTVCGVLKENQTNLSTVCQFNSYLPYTLKSSMNKGIEWADTNQSKKAIYVITPTYKRTTQKVDLTSMCYTLMHVPDLIWIVIEDATVPTDIVTKLLQRCKVRSVHLVVPKSPLYKIRKGRSPQSKSRGVNQRNAGLEWLRNHLSPSNCNGVLYFGDDDNKYDLRLFDEVRLVRAM